MKIDFDELTPFVNISYQLIFLSIDLGLKHLGYANIRYNKEGVKSFGLLLNGVNVQLFDLKWNSHIIKQHKKLSINMFSELLQRFNDETKKDDIADAANQAWINFVCWRCWWLDLNFTKWTRSSGPVKF